MRMVPRSGYTTAAASTHGGESLMFLDLNTSLLPHSRAVSSFSLSTNSTLRRTSTAPAPRPWAISSENTRLRSEERRVGKGRRARGERDPEEKRRSADGG